MSPLLGAPLDPAIMRPLARALTDGQLHQADYWLRRVDGRARSRVGGYKGDPLVRALEHLRSACGWLEKAA